MASSPGRALRTRQRRTGARRALAYTLLVETRFPSAVFYRRDGESWDEESFEGLNAVITLADIDEDVSFEPGRTISMR